MNDVLFLFALISLVVGNIFWVLGEETFKPKRYIIGVFLAVGIFAVSLFY